MIHLIIGFFINSIHAEKKRLPRGRIDISSTPKITGVMKKKVNTPKFKEALSITFEFITRYEPNVGVITIVGELLYVGKNMEQALKMWKSESKLPQDIDIEVKNFLLRRCFTVGLFISETMQLPPPFMFPQIRPKKEVDEDKMRYIG